MGQSKTVLPTAPCSFSDINDRYNSGSGTTSTLDLNNSTLRARAAKFAGAPVAALNSRFDISAIRGKAVNCDCNCNCNCTNCAGQCRSN